MSDARVVEILLRIEALLKAAVKPKPKRRKPIVKEGRGGLVRERLAP